MSDYDWGVLSRYCDRLFSKAKCHFMWTCLSHADAHCDCGLFALSFATDLCQGLDPTTQCYDQSLMRQHYVNCLESATMSPFPKTTRRVPYHMVQNKTSVPIFCQCRLPNDKREYVECFKCSTWYHTECAQVPEWAINSKGNGNAKNVKIAEH